MNMEQASPHEKKWRSISSCLSPKSFPSFLKWSLWYCRRCCFPACIRGLDSQHVCWQHRERQLMPQLYPCPVPQWGHSCAPCAFTFPWFSPLLSLLATKGHFINFIRGKVHDRTLLSHAVPLSQWPQKFQWELWFFWQGDVRADIVH